MFPNYTNKYFFKPGYFLPSCVLFWQVGVTGNEFMQRLCYLPEITQQLHGRGGFNTAATVGIEALAESDSRSHLSPQVYNFSAGGLKS